MNKRVNSTGRKRLEREHAAISMHHADRDGVEDGPHVEASFRFVELGLPDDALIIVEAYRQGFAERLPWGTVARPNAGRIRLRELAADGLAFRVKVVEPGTGRLLALAKRIPPGTGADAPRQELMRVRTADLGQELWRVVVSEAETPELLLNDRVPGTVAKFREPLLQAAILPAAMRAVLLGLHLRGEYVGEDDAADEWQRRWHNLAESFAGSRPEDDSSGDSYMEWVDRACAGFAHQFHLIERLPQEDDA